MSIRPGFPASFCAAVSVLLTGFAAGWFVRGAAAGGSGGGPASGIAVKASPGRPGPGGGGGGAADHADSGPDLNTPPGTAVPVKTAQALLDKWHRGGVRAEELGWRLLSLAESAPAGELTAVAEWARSAGLSQELRKALFEGIGRNPAVNAKILRGILTKEALGDWQVCAGLADGLAEGGGARLGMIKDLFGRNQQRVLRSAEGLALVRGKGFKGAMEVAAAAGLPREPGEDVGQSIRTNRVFSEALAMGPATAREMMETASKAANGGDGIVMDFAASLARTDLRGSLEWITTLPRETRGEIVMGVFQGGAAKDPEYTLDFLSRFPSTDLEQENILHAMQSAFSGNDPELEAQCGALLAELEARRKAR